MVKGQFVKIEKVVKWKKLKKIQFTRVKLRLLWNQRFRLNTNFCKKELQANGIGRHLIGSLVKSRAKKGENALTIVFPFVPSGNDTHIPILWLVLSQTNGLHKFIKFKAMGQFNQSQIVAVDAVLFRGKGMLNNAIHRFDLSLVSLVFPRWSSNHGPIQRIQVSEKQNRLNSILEFCIIKEVCIEREVLVWTFSLLFRW